MSRELERQAIASHFQSVWDEPLDGPIAWPNKPFTTPNASGFCTFNIVELGTFRMSLGRSFFKRHHGSMQIDMYVPQDQGTRPSRLTADRLEDLYEMLVLEMSNGQKIEFGTPRTRTLAANEQRASNLDDNWDRYLLEAPYHRDQHVEK